MIKIIDEMARPITGHNFTLKDEFINIIRNYWRIFRLDRDDSDVGTETYRFYRDSKTEGEVSITLAIRGTKQKPRVEISREYINSRDKIIVDNANDLNRELSIYVNI